jgi:hypothetical protein
MVRDPEMMAGQAFLKGSRHRHEELGRGGAGPFGRFARFLHRPDGPFLFSRSVVTQETESEQANL